VNLNPFAVPREDPFMVRIPINSQAIPAYQRVAREHLLNPTTGGLMQQRVPPEATIGMSITGVAADGSHVEGRVEQVRNVLDQVVFVVTDGREVSHGQTIELGGALMNVNAIIGRVVKKDKRAGMGFREDTFFPQGTPEGIAGATPLGMRAVTLDATKLTGVHALNAGDRIDLMASIPLGDAGSFDAQSSSSLPGAALVASASSRSSRDTATEPMLLAHNAMVLKPVYVRNEATTSSSLTQGKKIQNVPKYEVAIAVAPDDVIPLQSALNKGLAITCITHSMQRAEDATAPIAMEPAELMAPVTVRAVAAYDVVTREVFVSAATRRIRMEPISRQQADRLGIVLTVDAALGAIARHDIPAGSFVRKRDLLNRSLQETDSATSDRTATMETHAAGDRRVQLVAHQTNVATVQPTDSGGASVVGDRPAITSFIPAGRLAFAVPWNMLYGAEHLQIDDRVDIVASYHLERQRKRRDNEKRADDSVVSSEYDEYVSRETNRTLDESLGRRGEPWTIATDAIVVGPVGFPAPASALRAIGDAQPSSRGSEQGMSGPAILFAVDSRDIEALSAALSTEDVLFSIAFRSKSSTETPAGFKRIAVAPVELSAFELFSDLNWKGLRREITTRLVRADDVNFENAISVEQISSFYGRVLKRAKLRFEYFTPDDFLSSGVAPGVAAGIGGNTVAVTVTTDQVSGLGRFADNDRVALLAAGELALPRNAVVHGTNGLGATAGAVVQDARIVRSASDTSDTVTLEVAVHDVAALEAALAGGRLIAVARPRGIASPAASHETLATPIPSHSPIQGSPRFEAIVGRQSEIHLFESRPEAQP
ncbi:MAG: hypothetical protein WD070_07880, partial [Pirellulaceae bacterium]